MTGPSSERAADAETVRGLIRYVADGTGHNNHPAASAELDRLVGHLSLYKHAYQDSANRLISLERKCELLVARNQQLQEALDRIASGDINWQACKAEARAALASVRARSET